MHFAVSRYLALLYAIGLAIGETVISWGHWQFAPLWIIDYLVAICLLYAFYRTRHAENIHVLVAGWAFSLGVFYMDLFVNMDPGLPANLRPGTVVLWLIVLLIVVGLVGLFTALSALRAQRIQTSVAR